MGEVHLLKRAGQVSDFTGRALLGSLQGRGGGATMLSGVASSFRWTHTAARFVFKFFSSLLLSVPKSGSGEKRGSTGSKRKARGRRREGTR